MSIQIIRKNQQARGEFNGGEILENKPIGFPREGGHLKPYSNLFYWSHAWSDKGSTIGLHPHQGFEILSFVYEGSIEHFDTGDNEWKRLNAGAAQIIRSGSGISHSEKLNPGAHMFQIWFDPNLREAMQQPATYNDYPIDVFPVEEHQGVKTTTYVGDGSPFQMETPGVRIYRKSFSGGKHKLQLNEGEVNAFYIMKGGIKIGDEALEQDDFFIISESAETEPEFLEETDLFQLVNPKSVNYPTYAKQMI